VALTFLKNTLARVSSVESDVPGATGKKMIPFVATNESLTWVGILPARPNIGGRHFFRLTVEDAGAGRALVLRYAPWNPDAAMPNWLNAESRVLLQDVTRLEVQAQGLPPKGGNPGEPWPKGGQDGWPVSDALPEHLRVTGYSASGSAFPLAVALYALPSGDNSFSGVSFGGGAR